MFNISTLPNCCTTGYLHTFFSPKMDDSRIKAFKTNYISLATNGSFFKNLIWIDNDNRKQGEDFAKWISQYGTVTKCTGKSAPVHNMEPLTCYFFTPKVKNGKDLAEIFKKEMGIEEKAKEKEQKWKPKKAAEAA